MDCSGYFRPCGPRIGVRVRLWEVKIVVLKREIADTLVSANRRCPLTDGVRKSSEGSTIKTN